MGIIDIQTKKLRKVSQDLVDSVFKYLHYYNEGTPFQKSTAKRQLVNKIEVAHEFIEGSGKLLKIKPPKKITTYRTPSKMVHIINKD